jgi:hypothetical protein
MVQKRDKRFMMHRLMITALAAGVLAGSAAQSADVTRVSRTVTQIQPDRSLARLADQGLGYSVLHDVPGVPQRSYRVHVTCAIDESFMQTYCPTPQYVASCPRARIDCAGGSQDVQALRLKY